MADPAVFQTSGVLVMLLWAIVKWPGAGIAKPSSMPPPPGLTEEVAAWAAARARGEPVGPPPPPLGPTELSTASERLEAKQRTRDAELASRSAPPLRGSTSRVAYVHPREPESRTPVVAVTASPVRAERPNAAAPNSRVTTARSAMLTLVPPRPPRSTAEEGERLGPASEWTYRAPTSSVRLKEALAREYRGSFRIVTPSSLVTDSEED